MGKAAPAFPFFVSGFDKLMKNELGKRLSAIVTEATTAIAEASATSDLEKIRVDLLGRQGSLTALLKSVGTLPEAKRRSFGLAVNEAKDSVNGQLEQRRVALATSQRAAAVEQEVIDVTLPGRSTGQGSVHPITRSRRRIEEIFTRIGFNVVHGPEIEDDFHNFEALNIPPDHPARAMHDTFYLSPGIVLRTHTSPVQIRYMETQDPPLQVIAPGRVYRCDSDVTHTPMFHQVEGLAVDTDISFADLKGVLTFFIREFFEQDLPVRFRPSYFPFTEPSAEVDIGCVFCKGGGCRVCQQSGWLEILGCGMVHPEVFRHVGIDNDQYTGYAFGLGIERLTMLRYGVDDLRLFFDNEIAFLRQFS